MLKNLGIVQACFRSAAIPLQRHAEAGRPAAVGMGGPPGDRLDAAGRRDRGGLRAGRTAAARRLVPSDVPVFLGEGEDALARFAKALEQYPAEGVVRVRGDNLFIDPGLIDRLVTTAESHPNCDYVELLFARRPAGDPLAGERVCRMVPHQRAAAGRTAWPADPLDREQVTRTSIRIPEKFNLRLMPAPTEIDREDVRLTVDIEEDWEHALAIYEALGPERLDWQRIASLLDHQPALRSRMAALNRVHARLTACE